MDEDAPDLGSVAVAAPFALAGVPFAVSSGIQTLPVEVVEHILLDCSIGTYIPSTWVQRDHDPDGKAPQWIAITYVCHLWRQISLLCPRMWTFITTDLSLGWISAHLCRSRTRPLVLELDISTQISADEFRRLFAPHFGRVEKFYLGSALPEDIDTDLLLPFCDAIIQPAPLLESAILDVYAANAFMEKLFAGYAPRLRRLWLTTGGAIDATSPILHNLRSLKLGETLSSDETLTALQNTPFLERLRIDGFRSDPFSAFIEPVTGLVSLLHLSHISTTLSYDALDFLEQILLPPTAHVQVMIYDEVSTAREDQWSCLLDLMGPHLSLLSQGVSSAYICLILSNGPWKLSWHPASETYFCPPTDSSDEHYWKQLALEGNMSGWDQQCGHDTPEPLPPDYAESDRECLSDLCRSPFAMGVAGFKHLPGYMPAAVHDILCICEHIFAVADVTAFTLSSYRSEDWKYRKPGPESLEYEERMQDPDAWRPILRLMPEVRILKAIFRDSLGILAAITPDLDNPNNIWLPNLTTLILDGLELECPHISRSHAPAFGVLKTLLSKRREVGLGLKNLVVVYEDCGHGCVGCLQDYVENVFLFPMSAAYEPTESDPPSCYW